MSDLHPSHVTRFSFDASTYDEICIHCGATDMVPGGWGELAKPCPNPPKNGVQSYLEDPVHKNLFNHYKQKYDNAYSLAFTKEWKEKNLPKDSTPSNSDCFDVHLLDTTDQKVYKTRLHVAYEHDQVRLLDKDYEKSVGLESLSGYFYGSHHCPCHRKHDAKKAGAVVGDDECEGRRFLIKSITFNKIPDLILFSETYGEEELEKMLNAE